MHSDERATQPKMRKSRTVLTARLSGTVEHALAGITVKLDDPDIEDARRFGNALLLARDAWADRERFGRRYAERDVGPLVRKAHGGGA